MQNYAKRVACVAGILLFSSSLHAKTQLVPYLQWQEAATDNVHLQPSPTTRTELISEITPGIGLDMRSDRGRLGLGAFATRQHFYRDDVVQDQYGANGKMDYQLVPDYITVFGGGNVGQRASAQNHGQLLRNEFVYGDKYLEMSADGGVRLKNRQKRLVDAKAEASIQKLYNESVLVEDTETRRASASLQNGTSFEQMIWGFSFETQERDYQFRADETSWRSLATVGYDWARRYQLLVNVGQERLPRLNTNVGGSVAEGQTRTVQFKAKLGQFTKFEALYGERAFGETYQADLRYDEPERLSWYVGVAREQVGDLAKLGSSLQSGNWVWTVGYDERVEERRDVLVGRQLQLEVLDANAAVVQGMPSQWGYATTDVGYYLSRRAFAQVTVTGTYSLVQWMVSNETRESLPATSVVDIDTAAFSLTRNFNPLRSLKLELRYLQQRQPGYEDDAVNVYTQLSQKLGKHIETLASFNHWRRNDPVNETEANVVAATLRLGLP